MLRFRNVFTDGVGFDTILVVLALGYMVLFSAFPLVYNVVMSFQEVDLFNLASFDRPYVGSTIIVMCSAAPRLAAYSGIRSPLSASRLSRSLFWALGWRCSSSLIFRSTPGCAGCFFAGWIMPGLVVGAVWSWILAGDFGVLNNLLMQLGLTEQRIFWLSDPDVALYSVIIANIWLGVPFNMILLSVGLAGIPEDVYEAAEMDGAGRVQRFFTMTLPLMRAQLGAVISLGVIFTLQQFDLFASLTQGGPSNASNVFQYWSWQLSFQHYEIGAGSVISVLMILFVIVVAAIYVRSTRHEHTM